jgi:phosphomannomutase
LSDLRSHLNYQPVELRFGTSGRRGKVVDLTQLEIYINVSAELNYLLSRARCDGGIAAGDTFYFAHDLRPSSAGICVAVERAIRDAGLHPVNLGAIPTPALAFHAYARNLGSIMVTGSHIPFDLNGYKLNTSTGELMKEQEAPIAEEMRRVRELVYSMPWEQSPFDEMGLFREAATEVAPVDGSARAGYIERYLSFFLDRLDGRRIMVYQHSAVGRDLLAELLTGLGAEVITRGRSDTFVAIDTEAIDDAQLATIQALVDGEREELWAVVSTDGDSDRPLVLGVENGRVKFFPGDLIGMITAEYLGADAVVVPISCNDAIDRGSLAAVLEPKTKIGSPHVIAGMAAALARGREAVCGWEANGGFLLASDVTRDGRTLTALPTRDAMLPILATLFAARLRKGSLGELFATLPGRYSRSALLRNFPRQNGLRIVQLLTAGTGETGPMIRQLERYFKGSIDRLDYTDGVRILFANGEVAHFRPSGNADEFRIYAVADSQDRANAIVAAGIADPDGIIRRMERDLLSI